jgi:uncharacterized protein involved in exopolysaccharide biosynthesis
MELIDLLRIVRRWLWLIVAIVIVTELALWLGTQSAEPVYVATTKLQISTPQREDVAAYEQYRYANIRDEITVAINNFMELLQSDEVYDRTTKQLGLNKKDAQYSVETQRANDADFVNVIVEASTPELAAEIANAHVGIAIAYYGELRAQSTKAERDLFAKQLRAAEEEFRATEKALADFRTEHGIYSLETQMATQQRLLEQLQLQRDQSLLEQATTVLPTPASAGSGVTSTPPPIIDSVVEVDKLIAQRMEELDRFIALAPQYNVLAKDAEQARAGYQYLLGKYSEAELKVSAVEAANFMQIIKPAYPPTGAASTWPKLAVLALVGSLGLGVVLAFFLDYVSGFKTMGVSAPVAHLTKQSHRQPRKVMRSKASRASLGLRLLSALRGVSRELLKRLSGIFRHTDASQNRTEVVSPTDSNNDQESVAAQGQHGD